MRVGRAIALALGRGRSRRGRSLIATRMSAAEEVARAFVRRQSPGGRAAAPTWRIRTRAARSSVTRSESLGTLDLLVLSAASFRPRDARGDRRDRLGRGHGRQRPRRLPARAGGGAHPARARRPHRLHLRLPGRRSRARLRRALRLQGRPSRGSSRALAVELAPEVSVNGVAPGTVLVPEGTSPEEADRWATLVPLQRNGEPADVAAAVALPVLRPLVHHRSGPSSGWRQVSPGPRPSRRLALDPGELRVLRAQAAREVEHEVLRGGGELPPALGPEGGRARGGFDRLGHLQDVEPLAVARRRARARCRRPPSPRAGRRRGRSPPPESSGSGLEARQAAKEALHGPRRGCRARPRKISVRLRWPIRETHFSCPEKTARRKSRSRSTRPSPSAIASAAETIRSMSP